jgi:hypothetical protein
MESQSKIVAAVADLAAKERLEKFLHRRFWNGVAAICDPAFRLDRGRRLSSLQINNRMNANCPSDRRVLTEFRNESLRTCV